MRLCFAGRLVLFHQFDDYFAHAVRIGNVFKSEFALLGRGLKINVAEFNKSVKNPSTSVVTSCTWTSLTSDTRREKAGADQH